MVGVSELGSLLDQLAALDLADLDPGELTDRAARRIPLLQTGINQLARCRPARCAADRRRRSRPTAWWR